MIAAAGWGVAAAAAARVAVLRRQLRDAERRLDAGADAEHELRGAVTAFGLALDRLARDPRGRRLAMSLGSELERARTALGDLGAARQGEPAAPRSERFALDRLARSAAAAWQPAALAAGRRVELDWRAGPASVRGDRGRLAQALGNLLANAVEHGTGPIRLEARRTGGRVRLEVVNGLREARDEAAAGGPAAGRRLGEAALDVSACAEPSGRRLGEAAPRGRGLRIASRAVAASGGSLSIARGGGRASAAIELPLGG
ncbi:MAG TPA: ATP-binding protein [Thermoleophilaceae bacterium]